MNHENGKLWLTKRSPGTTMVVFTKEMVLWGSFVIGSIVIYAKSVLHRLIL